MRGISVMWSWTGLLRETDILVDGRFIRELRNMDLTFRGSSNQRFIDVPQRLAWSRVVEMTY